MTKTTTTTAAKTKRGHGGARPNSGPKCSYKPEYCQLAIETLSEGHSISGLAGKIGITKPTLYAWREKFPEFEQACQQGMMGAVYWWEQRARDSAMGGKGNPATIIFGLRNRAADDWRDRIEHTGPDGGPIQTASRVEYVVVDPRDNQKP